MKHSLIYYNKKKTKVSVNRQELRYVRTMANNLRSVGRQSARDSPKPKMNPNEYTV